MEYQVGAYDYYVKNFFLAKSLLYVLHYIDDDILLQVAIDEAAKLYKIKRADIVKHVQTIKLLNDTSAGV